MKFDLEKIEDLAIQLSYDQMQCCGLTEFSGLRGNIESGEDALHLRRAAFHEDNRGYVLATTTTREPRAVNAHERHLRDGGFVVLAKFRNPRTRNYVKLWGAESRKDRLPRPKDDDVTWGTEDW